MLIGALFFLLFPLFYSNKIIAIALSIFVSIVSVLLYFHFGESRTYFYFLKKQQEAKIAATLFSKIENPDIIIQKLISHLNQNPQSAKGWYLLGKLYFVKNDFKNALNAFSHARHLQPEIIKYQLNYLQTKLIFMHSLNFQDIALLKTIIQQNPNYPEALNLLATYDYLNKNNREAIALWEKLLPFFPTESDAQKQILSMIAKAGNAHELTPASGAQEDG